MAKTKATPKSRTRTKASSTEGKLARYWKKGQDNENFFDKFIDLADDLLVKEKFGWERLNAVLEQLDPHDLSEFVSDVEHQATNLYGGDFTVDGDILALETRLFAIPISGDVSSTMSIAAKNADSIAKSLRQSGFSPEQSSVVVYSTPMALDDVANFSPNDLHRIARISSQLLLGPHDIDDQTDMRQLITEMLSQIFSHEDHSESDQVTVGIRFLIGAQYTARIIEDDFADSPSPGPIFDDEVEDVSACRDAWDAIHNASDSQSPFHVSYPVQWGDLRSDLLGLHVDLNISMACAIEAREGLEAPSVDRLVVSESQDGIAIDAMAGERKITSMHLPQEALLFGSEEFIAYLFNAYQVEIVDGQGALDDASSTLVN